MAETTKKKGTEQKNLIDAIKSMTVLELSELVKALETDLGVTAAAPVAVAGPAAAGPAATEAPADDEATEFTVTLKRSAPTKSASLRRSGR
jgi:large subunit ribosomal protein L7/L12